MARGLQKVATALSAKGTAMFEVRIHGRGGQGVVTAAEMLSIAGFEEAGFVFCLRLVDYLIQGKLREELGEMSFS